MNVLLELPIQDAEELLDLLYLAPDRSVTTKARASIVRLEQAIRVERGPCGSAEQPPTIADQARDFIGQSVRIYCKDGSRDAGVVMSGSPNVLYIQVSEQTSRGIPLDRVASIELVA